MFVAGQIRGGAVDVLFLENAALHRLGGRVVAFPAIGFENADRAVGGGIVQRPAPRQDVVDVHFAGKQHPDGNLFAGIWAATVARIVRIQIFPQPQPHAVLAVFRQAEFAEFDVPLLIRVLILFLPLLDFIPRLFAVFQVAGDFQNDFARHAVLLRQRIHHPAHLIQAHMHRGVWITAVAFVRRVVRVAGAGQLTVERLNFLIRRQTVEHFTGFLNRIRMVVSRFFARLAVCDDSAFQMRKNLSHRLFAESRIAGRQRSVDHVLRLRLGDVQFVHQPPANGIIVFVAEKFLDNRILCRQWQAVPLLAD